MKSRTEVIEMIHKGDLENIKSAHFTTHVHFGLVELRALLDFIYCSEPKNDDELLLTLDELK